MQHGDAVVLQGTRQRIRVAHQGLGGYPQRGAHQIADPDFLERHVEGHREPLVHPVVLGHAQHLVLAAQEVGDVGVLDHDALGLARRATGVDHIGRVVRSQLRAPRQRAFHLGQQLSVPPGDIGFLGQTFGPVAVAHQSGCAGVFETHGNAVGRHIGIEGQPGCPCLGDAELHHQQLQPAWQPQAHDLAGAHPVGHEVVGHQVGRMVELRVGQGVAACAIDQRHLVRQPLRRGLEDIRQHLVPHQIGPARTAHNQGLDAALDRLGRLRRQDGVGRRRQFLFSVRCRSRRATGPMAARQSDGACHCMHFRYWRAPGLHYQERDSIRSQMGGVTEVPSGCCRHAVSGFRRRSLQS